MGFVNAGGEPPRPPAESLPADEPPPGDGARDMAALSAAVIDARPAAVRYRRRPEGIGRYAWAISLALHAVVLIGAYFAVRYYFPHSGTPSIASPPIGSMEPGSIVMSPDATDAVHGRWAGVMALAADPALAPGEEREIPPPIAREPQTIVTLGNLAPRSAVHALGDSGSTPWPLSPLPSSNANRR